MTIELVTGVSRKPAVCITKIAWMHPSKLRLSCRSPPVSSTSELPSDNERLKLLLDLNNAIISNLDLRELLRAISANVRHVMKCDSVGVALPDRNDQRLRIHAVDFPEGRGPDSRGRQCRGRRGANPPRISHG
jgi:transcriptional regulator with GAF, ATPase, and Fis domain